MLLPRPPRPLLALAVLALAQPGSPQRRHSTLSRCVCPISEAEAVAAGVSFGPNQHGQTFCGLWNLINEDTRSPCALMMLADGSLPANIDVSSFSQGAAQWCQRCS
jgi:hypothetical protein